ncbi:hypothetical protein OAL85_00415 [Methylophilaceae bacterium]|jgi:hypothetical protein|nr:hypothetical protein [Methylophilaceae bacterium]|tara:strand:- start:32 stop:208 length:177 start_codon:yes stop_codon:yes gene_type:complete
MKKNFYIDYPQEKKDPAVNNYRCKFCKEESLKINGLLEKHKVNCDYRIEQEKLLDEFT